METRKITVINSKTQKKSVINSAATTLGELKTDLTAAGIDYSDMTFFEGLTKTELKNDASLLPKDVEYKGNITNDLVFMLTNMDKKIKSGADMTRKEIYEYIKQHDLEGAVKVFYGCNYTNVNNNALKALIIDHKKKNTKCNCCESCNVKDALEMLIDVLYCQDYISNKEFQEVKSVLNGTPVKEEESIYSEKEIDEMFDFI